MHRFYVQDIIDSDKIVSITGSDVNHIVNVLRLSVGDSIVVSDGSSRDYTCKISSIDKTSQEVIADIIDINDSFAELPADIYLFQGVPKGDKLEFIVQKNIELGVHSIVPVMMERTIVKLDDKKKAKKIERYNGIAEAAAKQSRRGIIPEVMPFMSFKESIDMVQKEMDFILVPYESAEGMEFSHKVINDIIAEVHDNNSEKKLNIAIFIGPEGGFANSEIDMLKSCGSKIFSLGHRILRTETAGMMVMSILSFGLDD